MRIITIITMLILIALTMFSAAAVVDVTNPDNTRFFWTYDTGEHLNTEIGDINVSLNGENPTADGINGGGMEVTNGYFESDTTLGITGDDNRTFATFIYFNGTLDSSHNILMGYGTWATAQYFSFAKRETSHPPGFFGIDNDLDGVGPIFEVNRWYHIAMTFQNDNDSVQIYVDGQHTTVSHLTFSAINTQDSTANFGTRKADASFDVENAIYDSTGVWNKTLTQEEIQYLNVTYNPFAVASNEAPTININNPPDNDSNSVQLNVDYTIGDQESTMNVTLYINGTVNQTSLNLANGTFNITADGMGDSDYEFIVMVCDGALSCVNSSERRYYYDSTQPSITFKNPLLTHTTTNILLNWDTLVTDDNLWKVNYTITYSNGSLFYQNETGNLSVTSQPLNKTFASMVVDNYTLTVTAADTHTCYEGYTLLQCQRNLEADVDNKGITFTHGNYQKRVWFGYYNNGFNFLTDQNIQDFNINGGFSINEKSEYDFNLAFDKPANNILFGFAIKDTPDVYLIDESIGHFIFSKNLKNSWYMDFTDLIESGYPITYTRKFQSGDYYHIIYTATNYCQGNTGERCII